MEHNRQIFRWAGIILILATGAVHLIEAPEAMHEAVYKGLLFYANGAAALLAAVGINRKQPWGWWLGLAVAAGSLIGYILSRTVGLPMLPAEPDEWLEPLGVVSMVAEGLFCCLVLVGSWVCSKCKK